MDRRPPAARLAVAALSAALAAGAPARAAEPLRDIEDNSFLVEEAYNQEPGVLHNATVFTREAATGAWLASFTQEWPVPDERDQLSYTVAYGRAGGSAGPGDVALHYRRGFASAERTIAAAPRLTVLLPTGDAADGLGAGGAGAQVALPLSWRASRWLVLHTNASASLTPRARTDAGARARATTFTAAEGLVFLILPRVNLLAEVLWTRTPRSGAGGATTESVLVSPGVRAALDVRGGLQIVAGLGAPIDVRRPSTPSLLGYLSFEFPFTSGGR